MAEPSDKAAELAATREELRKLHTSGRCEACGRTAWAYYRDERYALVAVNAAANELARDRGVVVEILTCQHCGILRLFHVPPSVQ
jgi:hypothetical protein